MISSLSPSQPRKSPQKRAKFPKKSEIWNRCRLRFWEIQLLSSQSAQQRVCLDWFRMLGHHQLPKLRRWNKDERAVGSFERKLSKNTNLKISKYNKLRDITPSKFLAPISIWKGIVRAAKAIFSENRTREFPYLHISTRQNLLLLFDGCCFSHNNVPTRHLKNQRWEN